MESYTSIKQVISRFHETSMIGQGLRFSYFLFLYFLLRYFELLFYSTSLGSSLLNPLHESLSVFITQTSCYLLQCIYPDIHTSNHTIIIAGKTPIQILPGCTGLGHMLRLSLVLLVYPMSWLKKGLVFFPTILIVLFASTLHFLLLIPVAYHDPELYEFAHNYFTRSLFFIFIFLCWMIWEKVRSSPRNKSK